MATPEITGSNYPEEKKWQILWWIKRSLSFLFGFLFAITLPFTIVLVSVLILILITLVVISISIPLAIAGLLSIPTTTAFLLSFGFDPREIEWV